MICGEFSFKKFLAEGNTARKLEVGMSHPNEREREREREGKKGGRKSYSRRKYAAVQPDVRSVFNKASPESRRIDSHLLSTQQLVADSAKGVGCCLRQRAGFNPCLSPWLPVMRWLLPWLLVTSSILQVFPQNAITTVTTTSPPVISSVTEVYTRTQYCKWPCECPTTAPLCPSGVSLLTDGCECCKMCAKQVGEKCTEMDVCDTHRGLYCDYSRDAPRYEIGVCAQIVGVGCLLNGIRYNNGESFQPNCKYNCTCINGDVGCIPLCTDSKPPLVWCPNPKQIKVKGECCDEWACDYSMKTRKTSPRHISSAVYGGEIETWQKNCILQTSSWSPCSKSCGMGISIRISNDNAQCRFMKESRLCDLRPCEVDLTRHIKPGKKCLAVYRGEEPMNYTLSGCTSKVLYRPKYCGLCLDDRCCNPYKSKTIEVNFYCPDGTDFSRKIMWINACFCNLSCQNPNDIFADLAHYHDYSEIAN